jgi:predicted metal-dependent enzyme (double-stranded beta helix superfamily)
MRTSSLRSLRVFIVSLTDLIRSNAAESEIHEAGSVLLANLVREDNWLPDVYCQPDPTHYRQHLLHCDGQEQFSVVAFVWGPGQATPVHNHTVWGMVGMLRGAEVSQRYSVVEGGRLLCDGVARRLEPGDVELLSPSNNDIHKVANAYADRTSISIHAYGGNIGTLSRSTFGVDGVAKAFVSSYSNECLPNIWHQAAATK